MQDKWQDLIPYYIAGSLPDEDKRALEAYLRDCGAPCEHELADWRQIASGTWQVAQAAVQTLPPLSARVRAEVAKDPQTLRGGQNQQKIITPDVFREPRDVLSTGTAPVYTRQMAQTRRANNAKRIPLTLAAVFVTVLIFGGLILSQLKPDSAEQDVIELTEAGDGNGTSIAVAAQPSLQPEATTGILATPERPQPSATSTITPSSTPLGASNTPNPGTESLLFVASEGCSIQNNSGGALTTYRNASFEAQRVGLMQEGDTAQVLIATSDGWFELYYGNWVNGASLTLNGDCSGLITPTPTQIGDGKPSTDDGGQSSCKLRNDSSEFVTLYQWPSFDSAINGRLTPGEEVSIYLNNSTGWYQVFYAQWVFGEQVTLTGDCTQLWTPTATIPPIVTSTPLPPPSASNPIAVVSVANASINSLPGLTGFFIQSFPQNASLRIIASNGNPGDTWYLVQFDEGRTGWIQSTQVQVLPEGVGIPIAATVPALPTYTPTGSISTTPLEQWSHISTVQEHACGGNVGEQSTIVTSIRRNEDGNSITLTYPQTGTSFLLTRIAPNTFSGIYGAAAEVEVELTFNSATTYIANETVTHEGGCGVKITWAGSKSQ